jgi:hypothetical protein
VEGSPGSDVDLEPFRIVLADQRDMYSAGALEQAPSTLCLDGSHVVRLPFNVAVVATARGLALSGRPRRPNRRSVWRVRLCFRFAPALAWLILGGLVVATALAFAASNIVPLAVLLGTLILIFVVLAFV